VSGTGTNISVGSISEVVFDAATANASGLTLGTTPLTAKIDFTITGKTSNGDAFSIAAQQSFAKSVGGDTGGGTTIISNTATGRVSTGTGTIFSLSHVNAGNPVTITWSYRVSGTASPVSDDGLKVQLKHGGILVDEAYTNNLVITDEPGLYVWASSTGSQTISYTPASSGTMTLTGSVIGTIGGTPGTDVMFAVTNEIDP
jgi:hypothetical protein